MSDEIREQVLAGIRNQGHGMTVVQIYSVCPSARSEMDILSALRGLVAEKKVIKDGKESGGAIYYRLPGHSSKPLPTKPKHTPTTSTPAPGSAQDEGGQPKKTGRPSKRSEQVMNVVKKHGEVSALLVADELSITRHAAYQALLALCNKHKLTRNKEASPHTYSLTIGKVKSTPAQKAPVPDSAPSSEIHHGGFDFALWNSGDFTITKDGSEVVRLEPDILAGLLDYIGLIKPILHDMFQESTQ